MAAMEDVQEDTYDVTREQRRFARELSEKIVAVLKKKDLFPWSEKLGLFVKKLPDGSIPTSNRGVKFTTSFLPIDSLDITEALNEMDEIQYSNALEDFMPGGPGLLLDHAQEHPEFTDETVYKAVSEEVKIKLLEAHILKLFHQKNKMGIGLPARSFGFGQTTNLTVGNVGSLRPKPGPEEIRDQIVGEAARAVSANTVSPRALKTAVELRALKHGTHVEMDPRFSRYVSGALRTNQPPERKKTLTEALGRAYLRVKSAPYQKK